MLDLTMYEYGLEEIIDITNKARAETGCKLVVLSSENESMQAGLVEDGHVDGYFMKMHSLDGLDKKLYELYMSMDEDNDCIL